jgi:hypothetical protein
VELRSAGEVSSAEILRALALEGVQVTVEQLERWRQARLVPAARRVGRGGRNGVNRLHPAGTAARVLALVRLRPRAIGLAEATVRLWIAGFDLEEAVVRGALHRIVARHRKARAQLSPERVAESFGDELARSRKARRRWGATSKSGETTALLAVELVVRALAQNRPLDPVGTGALSHIFVPEDAERAAITTFTTDLGAEVGAAFDALRTAADLVADATWNDLTIARAAIPQFRILLHQVNAAPPSVARDLFLRRLEAFAEPSSGFLVVMLALRMRLTSVKTEDTHTGRATRTTE